MDKVLIVDKSADTRLGLPELHNDGTHEVSEAADGSEVMSALLGSRPNLMLFDLAMPRNNSFEVAKDMTAHERGCDVTCSWSP